MSPNPIVLMRCATLLSASAAILVTGDNSTRRGDAQRVTQPTAAHVDGVLQSLADLHRAVADLGEDLATVRLHVVDRRPASPGAVAAITDATRRIDALAALLQSGAVFAASGSRAATKANVQALAGFWQGRALDPSADAASRSAALAELRRIDGIEARSPEVVAAMVGVFAWEQDEQIRRNIGRDLSRLRSDDLRELWLNAVIADPSRFVREEAARNLLYFVEENPRVRETLATVARLDPSEKVRFAATSSLRGRDNPLWTEK